MKDKQIRKVIFSDEFEEYYANMEERIREKYDYALEIVRTQYLVSKKFVDNLKNSDFYELRVSISSNEYHTVLLLPLITIALYKARMYYFSIRF